MEQRVFGAILADQDSLPWYVDFGPVFLCLQDEIRSRRWFLSDLCDIHSPEGKEIEPRLRRHRPATPGFWIDGLELFELFTGMQMQTCWAVLSGLSGDPPDSEFNAPYADGNGRVWKLPLSIQLSAADIELVAWDCEFLLLKSRHRHVVERFMAGFPAALDLETYLRHRPDLRSDRQEGSAEQSG